tara:strand:- start:353 stop:1207 length:855 start_codon:yes stop_codon:yes gene_type:complete
MLEVIKNTLKSWVSNTPLTYSAAAAYYAVFSLPGMLIILFSITTFFLDEEMVRTQIQEYIGSFMGQEAAETIQKIIDNARLTDNGPKTLIIGGGVLLFGATGFFAQLKNSFNAVWGVKPKPEKTVLRFLVYRGVSLFVAIMFSFCVLVSMYVSAALKVFGSWVVSQFPQLEFLWILELSVSFTTIALLFTLIFKMLTDVKIKLRYAFVGGTLSSLLFLLGGLFFTKALAVVAPQSVFGAAGSIILLMIWVTYACMILQFGAEFIKALVQHTEEEIKTSRFVVRR